MLCCQWRDVEGWGEGREDQGDQGWGVHLSSQQVGEHVHNLRYLPRLGGEELLGLVLTKSDRVRGPHSTYLKEQTQMLEARILASECCAASGGRWRGTRGPRLGRPPSSPRRPGRRRKTSSPCSPWKDTGISREEGSH